MLGRWAVWPVMGALGLAMIVETWVSDALLYVGLAMTLAATVCTCKMVFAPCAKAQPLLEHRYIRRCLSHSPKGPSWTHSPTSEPSPTGS